MTPEEFKSYYSLTLTDRQFSAVTAVDGPVLLLAVPGSGKTTVLVARIGYMIMCCGIAPENILTLTYTVAATHDMGNRFERYFGPELRSRLAFRTINGICASILYEYGRMIGREMYELITDEKEISRIIADIYLKVEKDFAAESDISNVRTKIAYAKNMMLAQDEIEKLNKDAGCDIGTMYKLYQNELKRTRRIDYDDQMVYALRILKQTPELLNVYRKRYPYICVDEAQDTSRIQHEIIALLASGTENIFMVGDEDQSIYGFRAAYPQALLEFESVHPGAKVLLMEENFRSTPQIVSAADKFIRMNEFRHEKHMMTNNAPGIPVKVKDTGDRKGQMNELLKLAKNCEEETAVLYRDNESAIPLIDLLERKGIPYRLRGKDMSFFSHRSVQDVLNIIRFSNEPCNTDLFRQLYYKIKTFIPKTKLDMICAYSEQAEIPVITAAITVGELPAKTVKNLAFMNSILNTINRVPASTAMDRILSKLGYENYLDRTKTGKGKIEILRLLALNAEHIYDLADRLTELQEIIRNKEPDRGAKFILSTIHGSKGLEYDRVFLMDVADGIFPADIPGKNSTDEEKAVYEEERRLFYVAATRAKKELVILQSAPSAFRLQFMAGVRLAEDPKGADIILNPVPGMRIRHKSFGKGTVVESNRRILTVDFDKSGIKLLDKEHCIGNGLLRVPDK